MNKKNETLHIRVDSETRKKIQEKADKEHRSLSSQCAMVLEEYSRS